MIGMQVVEDNLLRVKHKFTGHSKPVSFVAWSPDDSMLLTCGNEENIKLWNTATGECKHTYDRPNSCFTSCAWFPDGRRFVSGGGDKCIYMWNLEVHSNSYTGSWNRAIFAIGATVLPDLVVSGIGQMLLPILVWHDVEQQNDIVTRM